MTRGNFPLLAVTLAALLLGVGSAFADQYLIYVATAAAWLAILAISFDVLIGFTGYLSLAHGALYGVGAYAFANFATRFGLNFWLALPAAGLVSAVIGAAIAIAAFRTRGLYFAVLTLGIGLIGFQLFVAADPLTGGVSGFVGIPSPPRPAMLGIGQSQYNFLLALGFAWLTYLAAHLFTRSNIGVACLAVREDVTLARAVGINISVARLLAFTFSAFFAGIAGALFASMSNFVGPDSFDVLTAGFQLVVTVVVGGMGTLWGPALGAVLLTSLPELLRGAATLSLLAYGLLMLAFIIFAPRGMAGLSKRVHLGLRRPPAMGKLPG